MSKRDMEKYKKYKKRRYGLWAVNQTLNNLCRKYSSKRGAHTEAMVQNLIVLYKHMLPDWIINVRKANLEEDFYQGIDLVVDSDVGKIYIQIKSSSFYADKFLKAQALGRYNKFIGVFVFDNQKSQADNAEALLEKIREVRSRIVVNRRS